MTAILPPLPPSFEKKETQFDEIYSVGRKNVNASQMISALAPAHGVSS
jgi:hypothetical protein